MLSDMGVVRGGGELPDNRQTGGTTPIRGRGSYSKGHDHSDRAGQIRYFIINILHRDVIILFSLSGRWNFIFCVISVI